MSTPHNYLALESGLLMKFELAPDNRGVDNETLLEDLRRVARNLKKDSLWAEVYDRLGRVHSDTIRKRFGSWNKALRLSGLRVRQLHGIGDEELFRNLEAVWRKLGNNLGASATCGLLYQGLGTGHTSVDLDPGARHSKPSLSP